MKFRAANKLSLTIARVPALYPRLKPIWRATRRTKPKMAVRALYIRGLTFTPSYLALDFIHSARMGPEGSNVDGQWVLVYYMMKIMLYSSWSRYKAEKRDNVALRDHVKPSSLTATGGLDILRGGSVWRGYLQYWVTVAHMYGPFQRGRMVECSQAYLSNGLVATVKMKIYTIFTQSLMWRTGGKYISLLWFLCCTVVCSRRVFISCPSTPGFLPAINTCLSKTGSYNTINHLSKTTSLSARFKCDSPFGFVRAVRRYRTSFEKPHEAQDQPHRNFTPAHQRRPR